MTLKYLSGINSRENQAKGTQQVLQQGVSHKISFLISLFWRTITHLNLLNPPHLYNEHRITV